VPHENNLSHTDLGYAVCGFGGLEVQTRPKLSDFFGRKIPQLAFLRKGNKQFVPCRRFAAQKRTLLDYVEVESLKPNYSDFSRSKFPPSLTEGLRRSIRFGALCRGSQVGLN
jgi:hypothetical protein